MMRWVWLAGAPHFMQMARSFMTTSATASKFGIGPNGFPRKSWSKPAQIT